MQLKKFGIFSEIVRVTLFLDILQSVGGGKLW